MGGFGSGRTSKYWRRKVENCHELDVNYLNRNGGLRAGWSGNLNWSRNGERVSSIGITANTEHISLAYRHKTHSDEWIDIKEDINLIRIPCNFGGERPYFICPGAINDQSCRKRVAKLYSGGKYFLCRHCYNLPYTSQYEEGWVRAKRKAYKIKEQLGEERYCFKPKGMHQKTFDRLIGELRDAEMIGNAGFVEAAREFLDE